RGVLIGAGAKILGNIEIGHCSRIAAGSVVLHDVPPNRTVAGVPARVVGFAGCDEPARRMDHMGTLDDREPAGASARRGAGVHGVAWAAREPEGAGAGRCAGLHGRLEGSMSRCRDMVPYRQEQVVQPNEIRRLERYLQRTFQLPSMQVRQRPQKDDSAEVYIGEEFIGVIFRDDEDEDLSYSFQMAILEYDLED